MKMCISLIILLTSYSVFAADVEIESLFRQGNDAYKKGEYAKAVEAYTSIYTQEYQSYNSYFNIGNTYYKMHVLWSSYVSLRAL